MTFMRYATGQKEKETQTQGQSEIFELVKTDHLK